MFGFLIYKIYTRIFEKRDNSPWQRTYIYISVNAVFLTLFLYLLIEGFFEKLNVTIDPPIFVDVIILTIPCIYIYYRYFNKRDISFYTSKFKNHWLNKVYFDALLILIPLFFFLAGPITRIILFGGSILKYDFIGILTPLFK